MFIFFTQMSRISVKLELNESELVAAATQILNLAKKFEQNFPNQLNLRKYTASLFEDLERERNMRLGV